MTEIHATDFFSSVCCIIYHKIQNALSYTAEQSEILMENTRYNASCDNGNVV